MSIKDVKHHDDHLTGNLPNTLTRYNRNTCLQKQTYRAIYICKKHEFLCKAKLEGCDCKTYRSRESSIVMCLSTDQLQEHVPSCSDLVPIFLEELSYRGLRLTMIIVDVAALST